MLGCPAKTHRAARCFRTTYRGASEALCARRRVVRQHANDRRRTTARRASASTASPCVPIARNVIARTLRKSPSGAAGKSRSATAVSTDREAQAVRAMCRALRQTAPAAGAATPRATAARVAGSDGSNPAASHRSPRAACARSRGGPKSNTSDRRRRVREVHHDLGVPEVAADRRAHWGRSRCIRVNTTPEDVADLECDRPLPDIRHSTPEPPSAAMARYGLVSVCASRNPAFRCWTARSLRETVHRIANEPRSPRPCVKRLMRTIDEA